MTTPYSSETELSDQPQICSYCNNVLLPKQKLRHCQDQFYCFDHQNTSCCALNNQQQTFGNFRFNQPLPDRLSFQFNPNCVLKHYDNKALVLRTPIVLLNATRCFQIEVVHFQQQQKENTERRFVEMLKTNTDDCRFNLHFPSSPTVPKPNLYQLPIASEFPETELLFTEKWDVYHPLHVTVPQYPFLRFYVYLVYQTPICRQLYQTSSSVYVLRADIAAPLMLRHPKVDYIDESFSVLLSRAFCNMVFRVVQPTCSLTLAQLQSIDNSLNTITITDSDEGAMPEVQLGDMYVYCYGTMDQIDQQRERNQSLYIRTHLLWNQYLTRYLNYCQLRNDQTLGVAVDQMIYSRIIGEYFLKQGRPWTNIILSQADFNNMYIRLLTQGVYETGALNNLIVYSNNCKDQKKDFVKRKTPMDIEAVFLMNCQQVLENINVAGNLSSTNGQIGLYPLFQHSLFSFRTQNPQIDEELDVPKILATSQAEQAVSLNWQDLYGQSLQTHMDESQAIFINYNQFNGGKFEFEDFDKTYNNIEANVFEIKNFNFPPFQRDDIASKLFLSEFQDKVDFGDVQFVNSFNSNLMLIRNNVYNYMQTYVENVPSEIQDSFISEQDIPDHLRAPPSEKKQRSISNYNRLGRPAQPNKPTSVKQGTTDSVISSTSISTEETEEKDDSDYSMESSSPSSSEESYD